MGCARHGRRSAYSRMCSGEGREGGEETIQKRTAEVSSQEFFTNSFATSADSLKCTGLPTAKGRLACALFPAPACAGAATQRPADRCPVTAGAGVGAGAGAAFPRLPDE